MKKTDISGRVFEISVGMSVMVVLSAFFSVFSFYATSADEVYRIALSGLSVAVSCTAAVLIIRGEVKDAPPFSAAPLSAAGAVRLIPLFLATFSVYYLLSEASGRLFSLIGLAAGDASGFPSAWYSRLAYVICAAVIPAVAEELLFRGTVLRLLLPAGERFGICASGVLFALSHWHPQRFLPVFFISVIFSLAYLATGSIAAPVILHLLNNLTVIAHMWITADLGEGAGTVFRWIMLILGAAGLVLMLLKYDGSKTRKIEEPREDAGIKDVFGTGAVYVMFLFYTVMILQSMGA